MKPSRITIWDENGAVLYTGEVTVFSINRETANAPVLEGSCHFKVDIEFKYHPPAETKRATPIIGERALTVKEYLAFFRNNCRISKPGFVRIAAFMHDDTRIDRLVPHANFDLSNCFTWCKDIQTVHRANFIVCEDGYTGEMHVLKNRWGETGRVQGNRILAKGAGSMVSTKPSQPSVLPPPQHCVEQTVYVRPAKHGCTCDIKDLMSTGHNPSCPEKK